MNLRIKQLLKSLSLKEITLLLYLCQQAVKRIFCRVLISDFDELIDFDALFLFILGDY